MTRLSMANILLTRKYPLFLLEQPKIYERQMIAPISFSVFRSERDQYVSMLVILMPNRQKSGIVHSVESKGVTVSQISMFNRRNVTLSAKLNGNSAKASILMNWDFWPEKVRCRKWLSRNSWNRKWDRNDYENNGQYEDSNYR